MLDASENHGDQMNTPAQKEMGQMPNSLLAPAKQEATGTTSGSRNLAQKAVPVKGKLTPSSPSFPVFFLIFACSMDLGCV